MNRYRISARKLLQATINQVWDMLRGDFTLVMDDGEIETNHKEVAYSRIFWEFHRNYPDTPLLLKHHFQNVCTDGLISASTHRNMFDAVVWDTLDTYRSRGVTLEQLTALCYGVNNELYNLKVHKLAQYMTSLDIIDFIEILNDPKVAESQKDLHLEPRDTNRARNQDIIDKTTDVLKDLFKENRYPNNPLSKLTRSKLVRAEQVYQGLGVRGYLTDTGSDIFPYPIMTGYIRGMNKFHDVFIESRSASKSLFFTKSPLQDAEYFSRKLQDLCETLKRLHPGDCGSTHYLTITMKGERKAPDGTLISKSDLQIFNGKYYYDEDTKTLKMVREGDKHLIGKHLKVRSPVAGCNHPDPYGICETCFGGMAENIPPRTNVGQATSTSMSQDSSQNVLSVKHFDGSSVVEKINIDHMYSRYIKPSEDDNAYILQDCFKGKNVKLIVSLDEAIGIPDIRDVTKVEELSITRVSEISIIGLKIEGVVDPIQVPVYMGKRLSSMTYEFLKFVKEKGWTTDANQNYVFDLTGWDYNKNMFELPFRHLNMSDHSQELAFIIERRVQEKKKIIDVTPEATLMHLSDVANSKLNVNIAVLEVIVLASMIVDSEEGDFRIPKPWTKKELGVLSTTIPGRSLSGALAYQDHKNFLTNPSSFFNRGRPSHPMDVFVMPKEVVDYRNQAKSV